MAGRATYDDFTGGDFGADDSERDDALPGVSEGPLFGRGYEARALLDLIDPTRPGEREVVAVVMGPPGTGRSALVSRVAREATARGWFPGGVLRLPDPGAPCPGAPSPDVAVAMAAMLRFLGLPDRQLPPESSASDAVTGFLLSSLATPGERLLVIAEDVTDATELRFLLSMEAPPVLLVTAVESLDLTAAATLRLGPLAEDPAARLITGALRSSGPTGSRRPGGSDGLRELVASCGRLPAALVAARALLANHPGLSFAALAMELTASRTETETDVTGHPASSPFLTGVLNAARRRLAPDRAEALRLLARAPGEEWSTQAIAALMGCSPAEVTDLLALPARLQLVERHGGGEGRTRGDRWRLSTHLPWDQAQASAPAGRAAVADQDEAALDRLFQYYDDLSAAADRHVRGQPANQAKPLPSPTATRH